MDRLKRLNKRWDPAQSGIQGIFIVVVKARLSEKLTETFAVKDTLYHGNRFELYPEQTKSLWATFQVAGRKR